MRVLLDESIPQRLRNDLSGHSVSTVIECGWAGMRNGELLALAAQSFDVFVTSGQNLEFQQNLLTLPIAVMVLVAPDNRLATLQALVPVLRAELDDIEPCKLVSVRAKS
jgi:predicted nuclease of predicted toxin-antitoxin system